MKNNNLTIIKRILNYIYKYKFLFFLSLLLTLVSVIGTLILPLYIGNAIDVIVTKDAVDFDMLKLLLLKCAIVVLICFVCQWIINILNNNLAYNITYSLKRDMFNKLNKLPLSYVDKYPYGDILSKMVSDSAELGDGLLMGFNQLFSAVATIIGILFFIFNLNYIVALIIILLTPMSLFMAKFISSRTFNLFKKQAKLKSEQSAFVEETISNQKIMTAYCQEKINSDKFSKINSELEKTSQNAIFYSSLTNPITRFLNSTIYASIVLCGSLIAINDISKLKIGTLTTLLRYASQYSKPFNEITSVFAEFQNTLACANRIFNLLDSEEETLDNINCQLDGANGNIEFNNVYFSYLPGQKLIENFNLNVKQGQRVAIVGPTGSGKTTLINLLMRFYDTTAGDIIIDHCNIKNIPRSNLRENFGMVLQETFLKKGTIKENILMGKPDATDEEVINASKLAHSYGFIKNMKNGFDTVISEDGGNLSQGQKQLLCITRVMLALPPMLILDEATSNIDTRTEMKIQTAFNKLMKGKTSFIVAHRLSTIKNVDIILVMNNGNVIEKGSHSELIEKKGFYYSLYTSQFI